MIPQAWLRWVPGCEAGQAPHSARRLGSGTAHALWRVRSSAGDFVVRAPDPALPRMLTTAFDRELQLQQSAATVGLAPRVVAADSAQQLMVMEHIDGRHLSEAELLGATHLPRLLAALARLHAQSWRPALAPMDPLANAVQFAQQIFATQPPDRARIERRLGQAAQLWRICAAAGRPAAVIHCDLHVGNIIARRPGASGEPLVLLDWEYAALGDPLLDYAALLAQYPAAREAVEPHFAALASQAGADMRAGPAAQHSNASSQLAAGSAVFTLLSWLWWRARAGQRPNNHAERERMDALEQRLDASLEHALGLCAG